MRDEDGFAAFAAANGRRLRHAARLLTGDDGRAEDLVQTALARTYLRRNRIRSDDPTAYVRRVMVNQHISMWRRHRGRESLTDAPPDLAMHDPNDAFAACVPAMDWNTRSTGAPRSISSIVVVTWLSTQDWVGMS